MGEALPAEIRELILRLARDNRHVRPGIGEGIGPMDRHLLGP